MLYILFVFNDWRLCNQKYFWFQPMEVSFIHMLQSSNQNTDLYKARSLQFEVIDAGSIFALTVVFCKLSKNFGTVFSETSDISLSQSPWGPLLVDLWTMGWSYWCLVWALNYTSYLYLLNLTPLGITHLLVTIMSSLLSSILKTLMLSRKIFTQECVGQQAEFIIAT